MLEKYPCIDGLLFISLHALLTAGLTTPHSHLYLLVFLYQQFYLFLYLFDKSLR